MGAATVIEVPRTRMGANPVRFRYSVIIAVPDRILLAVTTVERQRFSDKLRERTRS